MVLAGMLLHDSNQHNVVITDCHPTEYHSMAKVTLQGSADFISSHSDYHPSLSALDMPSDKPLVLALSTIGSQYKYLVPLYQIPLGDS